MAFHFTLETVLRFRQSLEDRELLRLQTMLARRAVLLKELDEFHQLSIKVKQETGQAMLQPIPAIELHFATARLDGFERQQRLLGEQLRELERAIAEQRSRFQQERRNREVLEALRDRQLQDYRLMHRRREQAQLDELHLLRRTGVDR